MADHLALPLRVNSTGRMGALTQDSPTEVAQSVALLLSSRVGERLCVPSYGTPPAMFGPQLNVNGVAGAIDAWEPRARGYALEIDTTTPGSPVVVVRLPATIGTSATLIQAASEVG